MATGYARMVADIKFRHHEGRTDLGDIAGLAASIEKYGLLHPVVINANGELIAGRRRLEAVKSLGWSRVAVNIAHGLEDLRLALEAERDENTCRKDYLPCEAVRIGEMIEEWVRKAAEERMHTGRPTNEERTSGKLPEVSTGQTRDIVGAAVGMSGTMYERAKKVTQAAKKDPEKFGDLPKLMDTKGVTAAFNELKKRKESKSEPPKPKPSEPPTPTEPTPAPKPVANHVEDHTGKARQLIRDAIKELEAAQAIATGDEANRLRSCVAELSMISI